MPRQDQSPGFPGTLPSAPSETFQRRGVRERAEIGIESLIGEDDRETVEDSHTLPWRMVCALAITGQSGGQIPGTGWFAGPRTIITAGHCVFDEATLLGFALRIVATPGLNGGTRPFGEVTATRFRTLQQWKSNADPDFDIGAISLDTSLGNQVGFFAAASRPASELTLRLANVSGYPESPGNGVRQLHSRNRILGATSRRLVYETDTTRGQSGAPVWIVDVDGGEPFVVGVHTYGTERTPEGFAPANSGTLINAAILQQIRDWVAEDGV